MKQRISKALRTLIAERAAFRCEYCLVKEEDSFLSFQVDHIIAEKHGGGIEIENLAYSCPQCNYCKGSDLVTFLDSYQDLVPLFNPRTQLWDEHFYIRKGEIIGLSRMGEATIKLLQFNFPERLIQRKILMEGGFYP